MPSPVLLGVLEERGGDEGTLSYVPPPPPERGGGLVEPAVSVVDLSVDTTVDTWCLFPI